MQIGAYEEFIAVGHYCRWLPEEGRRETWEEACARYVQYMQDQAAGYGYHDQQVFRDIQEEMVNRGVVGSMRALMTAGPALERDNVAGFNCAYLTVDHPRAFDELLYILMCGTGVGFSVERQYINQMPEVAHEFTNTETTITVADSKIGWAKAYRELVSLLYSGQVPRWDVSRVRPSGARLKTFGGRASGPEPLERLFQFTVGVFRGAAGRRLNSIECHSLCCKIAEIVVVGGVRRSALISLSNLTDDRLRRAKQGDWWDRNPHYALSNNSVCYTEKPDFPAFLKEWKSLYESYSGERGIFNRVSAKKQAGRSGRRDTDHDFGCNPCSEIILRPNQFCNLSEVVIRRGDTLADLRRKVRFATVLGTIQSTLTDFRYLRPIWKRNCDEERLLGVSLTGIMDHPVMSGREGEETLVEWLTALREEAIHVNKELAEAMGIPQSTAITCVKPSGTVSQLVNSASGIHPRYAEYYIRRVRIDDKDPLGAFMIDKGVPYATQGTNLVFEFPQAAPKGAITASEFLGVQQLELWKLYQDHWCEHKPSITVYYRDQDFFELGQWVYNHFDEVSGVAFLPYDDHTYDLAPYEPISEEKYHELQAAMPGNLDWSELSKYEQDDNTTGSQELACTGPSCEVVDIARK